MELTDHIQDFIDSCLPKLRSQWPEVRGSAAIVIGKHMLYFILKTYKPEPTTLADAEGKIILTLMFL